MKSQPITGKNAASSRITVPRMNPFNGERLLCFASLSPRCAAMPAEPIEEIVREAPSKSQPKNFAGPKGSAKRIMIGITKAINVMNPIQNVPQGVFSTRVCAREIKDGNKSHHAVSIAGNATPMINKMKKIEDMSAIGISFRFVVIRDTGMNVKKLQKPK